ncbi:hypothetical protein EDD18DRAFT_1352805 [Armillaria luteobubalina]|uniref:Uncharacterized protein n=1 Tax=Armillaria luteobubalina TaxID=153913 RepID=A0AA39UXD7_9AGAR|nr:hypothetical protein EDD18DRAFT_1352805 [Armillaria luteobubalina]
MHEIIEHTSESEAVHFAKVVPRIIGHKLPHAHDPCYPAFMLGHFKLFHEYIPLIELDSTILDTFSSYQFSILVQNCMKNWEALHECKDERDAESLKRRLHMFKDSQLLTNIFNGKGIDNLVELPDMSTVMAKNDAKGQHLLMKMAKSDWFVPVPITAPSEVHPLLKDLVITKLMKDHWDAQIKQLEGTIAANRINAAGKEQVATPVKESVLRDSIMDAADSPLFRDDVDLGV